MTKSVTLQETGKQVDLAATAVRNSERDVKTKRTILENAEDKLKTNKENLKKALEAQRQAMRQYQD